MGEIITLFCAVGALGMALGNTGKEIGFIIAAVFFCAAFVVSLIKWMATTTDAAPPTTPPQ